MESVLAVALRRVAAGGRGEKMRQRWEAESDGIERAYEDAMIAQAIGEAELEAQEGEREAKHE